MKLILFQLKLTLTKRTVLLLLVTSFLLLILFLTERLTMDKTMSYTENNEAYFQNCFFYLKLILIFISIYLYASSITKTGDYALYILRMFHYSRATCFFAKTISNTFIMLILNLFSFVSFLLVGSTYIGFYLTVELLVAFLNCFLLSILYGLFAEGLIQVIQNYFIMIVSVVIYIVSTGIEEKNIFTKAFVFLFPRLIDSGRSDYGLFHLSYMAILLFIINLFIYLRRDLNY